MQRVVASGLVAAMIAGLGGGVAHAAPGKQSTQAEAQAETLFDGGRAKLAAGKVDEACEMFESSQQLAPAVTTLLNLAACREKQGQLATAWSLFVEAARQTRTARDADARKLHQVADGRARGLRARLSTLTIAVGEPPDGFELRRDGEVVPRGAWNVALPLDGGRYQLAATAPGHRPWSGEVTLEREGDAERVAVPALVARPSGERDPNEPRPDPTTPRGDTTPPSERGSSKLPYVIGAVGLALGVGALGAELSARSTYDDAVAEPDDARQESQWESANTRRYLATGLAVGAVVGLGVATFLFVRGRGESRGVAIAPSAGPDSAGVVVGGRF